MIYPPLSLVDNLTNFLKIELEKLNPNPIKQIATLEIATQFPAMNIDIPDITEVSIDTIPTNIIGFTYNLNIQIFEPLSITMKDRYSLLDTALSKVFDIIIQNPFLGLENKSGIQYINSEINSITPKLFTTILNKEQEIQYLGYNINLVIYIKEGTQ